MWRKRLRLLIAAFVIAFAAMVVVSLRRGRAPAPVSPGSPRTDDKAVVETQGGGTFDRLEVGKRKFSLKFGRQLTYADGRTRLLDGVDVTLPDKGGRSFSIVAKEATLLNPPGHELAHAEFAGHVKLAASDGLVVTGSRASYDDREGVVRVPGRVAFSRGRMHGTGVGATYDRTRDVLWILDKAVIDVVPDEQGSGAMHVTSDNAGLARQEHYLKFTGAARLDGEGRVSEADDITVRLTPDETLVQRMELRGHSRITGGGAGGGAQAMQAQDIDLAYGPDGRTLQTARLIASAVLQLPGEAGHPGRRIAGQSIDVGLAADGGTVTSLSASQNVQVDLPADADIPARRIRSSNLTATGAEDAGLQNATFSGHVDFRETRPARKDLPAIDRTARSLTLLMVTAPGLGTVQRADFHGRVHFTDGTDVAADAPLAIYNIDTDRMDLSPSADPGTGPHVTDGQITVDARSIQMQLGTQKLHADTHVRSLIQPRSDAPAAVPATPAPARGRATPAPVTPLPAAASTDKSVKMPAMLKQDKPVNVTGNRLDYDGAASLATYTGNARLWQDQTVVQADTIVIDNRTGNMQGHHNVRSNMLLTEQNADSGKTETTMTTASADEMLYEDALHRITYTTKAHIVGPEGDITGDKIELYLTEGGGQLDHAEAYGTVIAKETTRTAHGTRLTYVAAKEQYVMTGAPVRVIDETPPTCKRTVSSSLTFYRAVDTIHGAGNDVYPTQSTPIACGSERIP